MGLCKKLYNNNFEVVICILKRSNIQLDYLKMLYAKKKDFVTRTFSQKYELKFVMRRELKTKGLNPTFHIINKRGCKNEIFRVIPLKYLIIQRIILSNFVLYKLTIHFSTTL